MRGGILITIAGVVAGTWASMGEMDMAIEFGLMPRATSTGTNLQVRSIFSILPIPGCRKTDDWNCQTFTGALGGAVADPVCPPLSPVL